MIFRIGSPLSLAAVCLLATPTFAQEGDADDDDAPTLIQDHGPASGAVKPPSPAVPKRAPNATGGAGPAIAPVLAPVIEVTVHEEEPFDPEERVATGSTSTASADVSLRAGAPFDVELAAEELPEARSPLADVELMGALPWQRHGEVGAALAWIRRPFVVGDSRIRYRPAIGVALHFQWDIRPWLHVRPYFILGTHEVDVPFGALSTTSPTSIRPDTVFAPIQARTFAFGGKLAPTLNLSARARAWLVAGVGYGRFGFNGVQLTEPGGTPVAMADRNGVFVEFPLGLGGAYEILPGRAAFVFEATGAPVVGVSGTAHDAFQVVDNDGRLREVGAFSSISASFVQTFGLSIFL